MKIDVFGKKDCAICESTKRKLNHFLGKWDMADSVPMEWFDMETLDGRSEGALEDVLNIPTVILRDDENEIRRWDGEMPDSQELRDLLSA